MNEVNSQIGILNNQAAPPKQRQELQAEIERLRGPFQEAIRAVRVLVDDVRKSYDDLAGNDGVKKALEMQRRSAKTNLKHGPSPGFQAHVALLREYEKRLGPSPSNVGGAPKARANTRRKGR